jgi:hypothetical protein
MLDVQTEQYKLVIEKKENEIINNTFVWCLDDFKKLNKCDVSGIGFIIVWMLCFLYLVSEKDAQNITQEAKNIMKFVDFFKEVLEEDE